MGDREQPDQVKVYVPRPYRHLLGFVFAGFFLLPIAAITANEVSADPDYLLRNGIGLIFLNLFTLIMAGVLYAVIAGASLTISPDGIEYNTFGLTVASPWENITGNGCVTCWRVDVRGPDPGACAERWLAGNN